MAAGFSGAMKVQPAAVSSASTWLFIWSQVILFTVMLIIVIIFLDISKEGKSALDNSRGR